MEAKKKLLTYAKKLGKNEEEVKAEFDTIAKQERETHPDWSDEKVTKRAMSRLYARFKKDLVSPAVWFRGVVLGYTRPIDTVAKRRKEAIELRNKDFDRAVEMKLINAEGKPIYPPDSGPAFKRGQEMPKNNFIRPVFGVCSKADGEGEKPMPFKMILGQRNNKYQLTPPLFQPLKFRANERDVVEGTFILNAASVTEFEADEELKLPPIEALMESDILSAYRIELKDIFDYHRTAKDDPNRIVITEGNVVSINRDAVPIRMTLHDIGLPDEDESGNPIAGITCFIPPHLSEYLDFGEESRVIVVGRTGTGRRGGVILGVTGIYAIPEFRVALEEEPAPTEIPVEEPEEKPAEEEKKPSEEKPKEITW